MTSAARLGCQDPGRGAGSKGHGAMSIPLYRHRRRRGLTYALAAVAIQVVLAVLIAAAKLRSETEDTDLSSRYATWALQGKRPYRDYTIEYPPLALPIFLAPRAVAPSI